MDRIFSITNTLCTYVHIYAIFFDASEHVFSVYVVNSTHGITHAMWSPEEMERSSTWRELVAVQRVLVYLNHKVEGKGQMVY